MTGTDATANSAEKSRSPTMPPPRCATSPREQEMERRAAPLGLHRLEQAAQRLPADEERERLVLVRRPGGEPREQEDGDGRRAAGDPEPERP